MLIKFMKPDKTRPDDNMAAVQENNTPAWKGNW